MPYAISYKKYDIYGNAFLISKHNLISSFFTILVCKYDDIYKF